MVSQGHLIKHKLHVYIFCWNFFYYLSYITCMYHIYHVLALCEYDSYNVCRSVAVSIFYDDNFIPMHMSIEISIKSLTFQTLIALSLCLSACLNLSLSLSHSVSVCLSVCLYLSSQNTSIPYMCTTLILVFTDLHNHVQNIHNTCICTYT